MASIVALYEQSPYWVWLALAALFVVMALITGARSLIWPSVAAAVVAGAGIANMHLAPPAEIALFIAITLAAYLAPRRMAPAPTAQVPGMDEIAPVAPKSGRREMGTVDRTGRLVGRIGRTTSEFANGVGRVWIEGAEWAAELEGHEDDLPPEAPVRITRVIGGVRLQVRALTA
jgi:inner membrane protein